MFCPNCGKEIVPGGVYCPRCGCRVGEGEPRSKKRKQVAVGFAIAALLVLVVVFAVAIAPRLFSKPSLEGTWTLSSTGTANGITLAYPDVTLVVEDGAFSMDIVGTAGGMSLFGLTGSDQVDISVTGSCVLEADRGGDLAYSLAFEEVRANEPMLSRLRAQYGMTDAEMESFVAQMNDMASLFNGWSLKLRVPKSGLEKPIGEGEWVLEMTIPDEGYGSAQGFLSANMLEPSNGGEQGDAVFSMTYRGDNGEQVANDPMVGTWHRVDDSHLVIQYVNLAGGNSVDTTVNVAFTPAKAR